MKTVNPNGLVVISAILFTTMLTFCDVEGASGTTHELGYYYFPASKTTASYSDCGGGSIGECLTNEEDDEEEWQMDSESNRRMLAWRRRFISYGALIRNRIPCSRSGASYYNCHPHGPVNPYTRGCSAITRCRS